MTDLASTIARFTPDQQSFVDDPYPALAAIRAATPLFRDDSSGQWMVTRFDDVDRLLRDPRLGRSYRHRFSDAEFGRPPPDDRWQSFAEHDRWALLNLEPPDHARLRRLIAGAFTPSSVADLAPSMALMCDRLLRQCRERGAFDLLSDFAQPFSVGVIADLLGLPTSDGPALLDWSHRIVKMYELVADDVVRADADDAAGEFISYVEEHIGRVRRHPDGRLLSALANVEDGGDRLSTAEVVSTAMSLVEAGHEATVNTLGNGVRALLDHRDQWQRLLDGTVTTRSAVEELLRFDSPLQLFSRWILDDGVVVGGRTMRVGEQVGLLFGSAQRDPDRFAQPDRFDVGRNGPAHLAFGAGIHFCVGAPLARNELRIAVAGLVQAFPRLELTATPEVQPTFVIRGIERLDVVHGEPGA